MGRFPRFASTVPQEQARKAPARKTAIVDNERCTCCGLCIDICAERAISLTDVVIIDSSKCTGCGSCAGECPNEAISMSGATRDSGGGSRAITK